MADISAESRPMARRKFAMPPVKLACLSCRASRTRCDGGQPCASCAAKGHDCAYRPSRRGGPRVRKKTATNSPPRLMPDILPGEAPLAIPMAQATLDVPNFIDPGAALGLLPDLPPDSDFIFDNLFLNAFADPVFEDGSTLPDIPPVPEKSGPLARAYHSDADLLQAYYCWIHPFVPIFPPPEVSPPVDKPVTISQADPDCLKDIDFLSPVALALSAVLALIPCADDTDPSAPEAVLFRRNCAQFFAQAAIESIETESELPDSSTEPSRALEATAPSLNRRPFHPRVPVDLESIVALNLLSIYEYAQRGNLKKMKSRAGQALMEAIMTHNLHAQTDDYDYYAEAKRRIWWITYTSATQSSIVSCTPPPLALFNLAFTTKYPRLDADPKAWPIFIEAQQCMLAATEYVISLNEAMETGGDMAPIYKKMIELETSIAPIVERCEAWTASGPLAPVVDASEVCLVRSLRSMAKFKANSARIKVHRYCAFMDMPIFTGKVCDLKTLGNEPQDGIDTMQWPSCMCSPMSRSSVKTESPESQQYSSASGSPETVTSMTSSRRSESYSHRPDACLAPFSSHYSAKICLRSALNIANGFDNMPFPNPVGQMGQDICFLSPTSGILAPRMLPSFVCCAMQGAYVFLTLYRKTNALPSGVPNNDYMNSMLLQLQQGLLSILSAVENYATAFEAIRAMRDNVRMSADSLLGLKPV